MARATAGPGLPARFSGLLLTIPKEEIVRRAHLLSRMGRLLSVAVGLWGTGTLAAWTFRTLPVDWAANAVLLVALAVTALLTLYAQARQEYQVAALAFIFGFSMSVSIAVWQFGGPIPEVHLGYLIPIALAAALWGSPAGSVTALGVWVANVWVVAAGPPGGAIQYTNNVIVGLAGLGAAYFAVALVVGRYAENLVDALGRAEQKAREALGAERKARLYADELEGAFLQTVLALAKAVEAKDTYTADHGERLADLGEKMARRLGLTDPAELQALRFGAILHDVGKIGVPDAVLKKPGRLDPDEWELMRQHPAIGCRILEAVPRLQRAGKVVRHHHERWDGKGYPDGLAGEDIPLPARIITVVDSFCAIVESRVYKPARSTSEAVAELQRGAGSQFDPRVVEAFIGLIQEDRVAIKSSTDGGAEALAQQWAVERPLVATVPELHALTKLIAVASGSLDANHILQEAARMAVDLLGVAAVGMFLYCPEDDSLQLAAECGLPAAIKTQFVHFPVNGFHNEVVVREAKIVMHGSPADVPEFMKLGIPEMEPDWGTYLCVPLTAKGEVMGVMGMFSHRPRVFDELDHALYRAIGEQLGLAIVNARLYESVQHLAATDGLTGLYNRRSLDDFLGRELDRCARYQHGVSLIMLDIDQFKEYNDACGHPAGDEALREVACLLQQNTRAPDLVARYGGEEFAIVLPETDAAGARAGAEKIRAAIEAHQFPNERLTASLGVACCRAPVACTTEELISMADGALYEAKEGGRNRVCTWEEA